MGSFLRHGHRAWLKVLFVVVLCFAAGLVSAGVVSGAGPLAALSSVTDSGPTETGTTETTTDSTGTDSTDEQTTESDPTETTTTEASPGEAATPSLSTDKDDYFPGEPVILSGAGWQPDEAIHVFVNDDEGQSWSHNADVVAGADGSFVYEFFLPDWFVAVYTVKATGASSGLVTMTFTDSTAFGGCPAGSPITVTTTADELLNPGPQTGCSLREAIQAANADGAADTIILPAGTYTLARAGSGEDVNSTGDLDVREGSITIVGANARTTIIQAGPAVAAGIDRVFHVRSNGNLTLSNATVQFGTLANAPGGGIRVDSGRVLTLTDVTVGSNTVTGGSNDGGGIYNEGTLTANRVTIAGNSSGANGGGLVAIGTANLTNVTLTNNIALNEGGGLRVTGNTTTLTNVTVSHNTAATGGGVRRDSGTLRLRNTIVADNTATSGANCSTSDASQLVNVANNLDSGTTCGWGSAAGSQSNANAMLGALANNGGPTDTRAIAMASAAVDTGTAVGAPGIDQRSVARPQDGNGVGGAQFDIGAYERAAPPANSPPVAVDDTYPTNEDTNLVLDATSAGPNQSPVDNDTDANGQTLTVTAVGNPTGGTVALASGTITFDPNDNLCGTGAGGFDYTVSDGNGGSDTGRVTVNITCVDDPGTAVADTASVGEDSGANTIDVLANDTDPDGGSAVTAVTQPANGTVVNNGTNVSYTPNAGYCNTGGATDDFTYTITGGSTAAVAVTVECVNDAPEAEDDSYDATEDTLLSVNAANGVLANDTDADGNSLTAVLVTDVSDGTLTLNADGSFDYTPDASFCGEDSFTYKASDGDADSNVATVTIVVECVNDAPNAVADEATVDEDSVANPIDVLANDTDPDGNTLTVSSVTDPANGTAVNNSTNVTYTPDPDFCGADSFEYTISDGNGGADTAAVDVTVECVNDAPEAEDDSYDATEDTLLSVNAANGVLANDTDADGDSLTAVLVTDVSDGTLTLNADGSFDYTPDANFCGEDSFTYQAQDDSGDANDTSAPATATIVVECVNDAPNAVDDSATVVEDSGANTIAVLGNDTDVDGDSLVVSAVTQPAHGTVTNNGANVSYTPDANYCNDPPGTSPDTFTYTASDGKGGTDTATVSITVTCVNDAPSVDAGGNVSGAEGSPIALDGTVSDVEGDTFTVVWTYTAGAGVDAGATCSFGNANAVDTTIKCTDDGTYTATLTATDSHGAAGSDSTTVTVSNANPVVTITSPDESTAPVSVGTVVTVQATFTDAGVNDTHTCSINWDDGTTTVGAVTEAPQSGSGSCTGTHAYAALGVYDITVTVTDDDGGSGSDTAQIVVFDPNAGFVTGGGWVTVQPGSYTVDPSATGKGNFGFVSKYKQGASAPTGETEFNFNTASFRFHSDTYKFLLVSGFKAQYVGTGSVNGVSGYDFRLTAYDGQVNGGGGVDRFRIKIRKNGVTIFDNRITSPSDDMETADPQAISGGSIVIHKAK